MKNKKNQYCNNDFYKQLNSQRFAIIYRYAINMIEIKLHTIQNEMAVEYHRNIISTISNRIKSAESIKRKLIKKKEKVTFKNAIDKLNDVVGVRAICFFEDDIYELVNRLKKQKGIKIIKIKDYIKNPKDSGYKSLHIIVKVPIYSSKGQDYCKVEIQFRTVAMDFWSELDYQLRYKKQMSGEKYRAVSEKLLKYADDISDIDRKMLDIRKSIEKL